MLFVLRELMRVAHLLAAGTWIGGSVVYLLVIGPALRLAKASPEVGAQIARLFRQVVNWCIGVLIASGVFLAFDRLTSVEVGILYVVVLALKVATAITCSCWRSTSRRRRAGVRIAGGRCGKWRPATFWAWV